MQHHVCTLLVVWAVMQRARSLPQPKCSCIHLKDLRDLAPLYPAVRSRAAKIVSSWRKVEARIGVGNEVKFSLLSINQLVNVTSEDLSVKDYVQRKSQALFLSLESKILTNWVWGPRQNKEAAKLVIKPISRIIFDKTFKTKIIKTAMTELKKKIRNIMQPNLIIKTIEDFLADLVRGVTDETEFEEEYAFDQQVHNDFNFNVGRKLHVLKVAVKVWSCMSGTPDYHEQKLLDLARDIQLVEMIQNFLPIVPSPIIQEQFTMSVYRKLHSLNYSILMRAADLFLDVLEDDITSQDLYIPYMAGVNIWNNLLFGNLHSVESFLAHVNHVVQSKKFWKKFDSLTLSLWSEKLMKTMGKMARSTSRVMLRYLGEKSNSSNRTSYNRINDIWENIFTDFDQINLNPVLENMFDPVLSGRSVHSLLHIRASNFTEGDNMLPSSLTNLTSKLPTSFIHMASMLTKSSCGENQLTKALQEIGFTQFMQKARTRKRKIERKAGGHRENMKKKAVRIETYLGREVGLVVEWVSVCLIWGGHKLGWW